MKLFQVTEPFTGSKQIIILCGNIASGKGHYALTYFPDAEIISVSSVVKELTNFRKRSDLSTTANLDNAIANLLIERILNSSKEQVVVDGIRQITIMEKLERYFKEQVKDIIWLDVPEQTLRSRFEKRNAGKDDMSFKKALQSDKELGIGDVESYIRKNHRVIPY